MSEYKNKMNEIQELLFGLTPLWNYNITKPLKQSLEAGMSMDMYYCIQILRSHPGSMRMREVAERMQMSKQQATKLIDKMVENALAERIFDEKDRRVIKIQETKHSKEYIDDFLNEVDCFHTLLSGMSLEEQIQFKDVLQQLYIILAKQTYTKNAQMGIE